MRAYKFRLYPNEAQKTSIAEHFGCARFVYNWGLQSKIDGVAKCGISPTCYDLIKSLPALKAEKRWLSDVNSQSLQSTLRNLDDAYNGFFRENKGFPRFKTKRGKQSFQCPQHNRIENGKLYLPKIKGIRIVQHRDIDGEIGMVTISMTTTGKYYVSFVTDAEIRIENTSSSVIGIDLGIKTYATCSNGIRIENPKWIRNSEARLSVLQRRASKKLRGSSNREKANMKTARLYEKISNQRLDWQHKETRRLVNENKVICLETLDVAGMMKHRRMAKLIQECSWSQFNRMLEYKADLYGSKIIRIGRFVPSSKTCTCGGINNELKLSDRTWKCKLCGATHDRDLLAAQNILMFATCTQSGQELPVEPVELSALVEA